MTFEKAVIDAKNSFVPGQVYVALSRIKSMDGLILQTPLNKESIKTDQRVISFYNKSSPGKNLQKEIINSNKSYRHSLLVRLLQFETLIDKSQSFVKSYNQTAFAKNFAPIFDDISNVLVKFDTQLSGLLIIASQESYSFVKERITKAVSYFTSMIEVRLMKPVQEYTLSVEENKKNEPFIKELNVLFNLFHFKIKELTICERIANGLVEGINTLEFQKWILEGKKNFESRVLETKKKEQKTNARTTQMSTLSLFQKGLTIEEIVQKRKLNKGIIEDHLRSFIKSGQIKLQELIPNEKAEVIMNLIKNQPTWSVHELKLALGFDYSFGEIRAVLETL
jgi:hypothetical protein